MSGITPGGMSVCPKCNRWSCSCRPVSGDNHNQGGVRLGAHVIKAGGDFHGIVVSDFTKASGARRVVVENPEGILHIFNPTQLRGEVSS